MRRIQKVAYALGGALFWACCLHLQYGCGLKVSRIIFPPLQSENPKGRLPWAKNPTKLCI